MKYLKLYENFEESELSGPDDIDLSLELECKLRTPGSSNISPDDFFDEFDISSHYRNDTVWNTIVKNTQKYKNMSNKQFFKIYNKYRNVN